MSTTMQCISGRITAKYHGKRRDMGTVRHMLDGTYDIHLTDCVVEDAVSVEQYSRISDDVRSIERPRLHDVTIYYADDTCTPETKDLVRVIIRDVLVYDVAYVGDNVYGTVTGTLYGTVPLVEETTALAGAPAATTTTEEGSGNRGCAALGWGCGFPSLMGFLLLLFLLWLLWCFLFGPCTWGRTDCNPVLVRDTIFQQTRDTVHVFHRDTITRIDTVYITTSDLTDTLSGGRTLGTGPLQISLFWHDVNDLDLVVETPLGSFISFASTKGEGGELDVDMNRAAPLSRRPVENIYWADTPPAGDYRVYVVFFKRNHAPHESSFIVRVKQDAYEALYQGALSTSLKDTGDGFDVRTLKNKPYAVLVHEFNIPR